MMDSLSRGVDSSISSIVESSTIGESKKKLILFIQGQSGKNHWVQVICKVKMKEMLETMYIA